MININLDYQSRIPIYEQIITEIEKLVTLGILLPDTQIPTIRDLANNLNINPNTVKKAYDILEQKGLIISKSTKGTFIAPNIDMVKEEKIASIYNKIDDYIKELESYGLKKKDIIAKIK